MTYSPITGASADSSTEYSLIGNLRRWDQDISFPIHTSIEVMYQLSSGGANSGQWYAGMGYVEWFDSSTRASNGVAAEAYVDTPGHQWYYDFVQVNNSTHAISAPNNITGFYERSIFGRDGNTYFEDFNPQHQLIASETFNSKQTRIAESNWTAPTKSEAGPPSGGNTTLQSFANAQVPISTIWNASLIKPEVATSVLRDIAGAAGLTKLVGTDKILTPDETSGSMNLLPLGSFTHASALISDNVAVPNHSLLSHKTTL